MLKISIVAKNEFAVLGINGVQSFFESAKHLLNADDTYDAVQLLDQKLMSAMQKMETFEHGFTEEYKAKFLQIFEKHLNEHILISSDWLGDWNGKKEQNLMKFVGFLNDGFSFEEAKNKVNAESKEVELV